jgi:Protein of unknown function (DUF1800)
MTRGEDDAMFSKTRTGPAQPGPAAAGPIDPAWAWAPYTPDAERPWDLRRAGHLYRRAGFGASWDQLQQALRDGPTKTVDRLVRPGAAGDAFNRTFDGYEGRSIDPGTNSVETLRDWWLRRMIQSPHPLLEKMTLFWHDHFAASSRVKNGWLMAHHVSQLRAHALGRVEPLLAAVVRDPALLLGYAAATNRKSRPEQTIARAWLERFTVGPGQATARDVSETARAFTGRFVLRNQYRELAYERDGGTKTVLGTTGDLSDADIVRITAKHPATARNLARRVYRWLVSEADEPSDALLAPLVEPLAASGDIGRLVETILRSNHFFSPAAYRRKVKSPVELAVGIVRGLDAMVPTTPLGNDLADLGQNLGQPPTSQGWVGGTAWINTATSAGRANLAASLLSGAAPYPGKLDPYAVAKTHGQSTPDAAARWLVDLMLQGDLPPSVTRLVVNSASSGDPTIALRSVAHTLAALPEFQLA